VKGDPKKKKKNKKKDSVRRKKKEDREDSSLLGVEKRENNREGRTSTALRLNRGAGKKERVRGVGVKGEGGKKG